MTSVSRRSPSCSKGEQGGRREVESESQGAGFPFLPSLPSLAAKSCYGEDKLTMSKTTKSISEDAIIREKEEGGGVGVEGEGKREAKSVSLKERRSSAEMGEARLRDSLLPLPS